MTARTFVLRHDSPGTLRGIVDTAIALARQFYATGIDVAISVGPWQSKRSREQNRLMWALLEDVAKQKPWMVDGKMSMLEPEDWKHIMTAGLVKTQRVAAGIDGGFVILGVSTRPFSVSKMSDLIELIFAFGAEHGIRFREPTQRDGA